MDFTCYFKIYFFIIINKGDDWAKQFDALNNLRRII